MLINFDYSYSSPQYSDLLDKFGYKFGFESNSGLSSTVNSITSGLYTRKSPQILFNFGATGYFEIILGKTKIKLDVDGIVGKFYLVDSEISYSKYIWKDTGFNFSQSLDLG